MATGPLQLPLDFQLLPDRTAWQALIDQGYVATRHQIELGLARIHANQLSGYCVACEALRRFVFNQDPQAGMPNWREELACDRCGLFNRVRFCLAFMLQRLPHSVRNIYITEQVTAAYAWLKRRWPETIGSEFITKITPTKRLTAYIQQLTGDANARLRHEDLTALTLPDMSQDAVLSFDVLEHIPDAQAAMREIHRVLRPGGLFVFTVPFHLDNDQSLLRARLGPDGIDHLLEPEFHGDPATDEGCLAFHSLGWDLLDQLRAIGFVNVALLDGWSVATGNLGLMGAITASRPR